MKTDTTTPAAAPRDHASDARAAAIALNIMAHGAKTLNRDIANRVWGFLRHRAGVVTGQIHPGVQAIHMGTSMFIFTRVREGKAVMIRWEDLAKGSAPAAA